MKRYISLALAAAVLICFLIVPVYASDFGNVEWYDVLDFTSLNSSGNSTSFNAETICYFTLDPIRWFSSIDIVVSVIGSPITSAVHVSSAGNSDLTISRIDDNLYRIYGSVRRQPYNGVYLTITSSGSTYIEFNSVRLLGIEYGHFDEAAHGYGTVNGANDLDIGYNYNSLPNYYMYSYSGDYRDTAYRTYYQFPNWRKYDYMDLQLYYVVQNISTISATIGDVNIPFSVSYLENPNITGPNYFVTLRFDLTGIDRTTLDDFEVQIMGNSMMDITGMISIIGCSGYVELNNINPLYYYFRTLQVKLEGWFSNVGTWISNQTSTLTSSLSTWFGNVDTWIKTQTNSITASISSWGQKIVDVLTPDTDAADSVVDKTQQQAEQMDYNNNALQQLQRPDINTGASSGDISGIVSPSNTIKYTLFLSRIMQAPILSEVIMLSMIFSLAAYVLFGKR